jgi:acylphosphatase
VTSRRFLISGTVQGVGCRAQIASRVHERWPELRGYVKNLEDGRVEVQAAGDAVTLSAVAEFLRTELLPPVQVLRVEEEQGVPSEFLGRFGIQR